MWDTVKQTILPSYREKKKKQEFLDILAGVNTVQVDSDARTGTHFQIWNTCTGDFDMYYKMGDNDWIAWGTSESNKAANRHIGNYTHRQLELRLTEIRKSSSKKNQITIIDESGCLIWNPS